MTLPNVTRRRCGLGADEQVSCGPGACPDRGCEPARAATSVGGREGSIGESRDQKNSHKGMARASLLRDAGPQCSEQIIQAQVRIGTLPPRRRQLVGIEAFPAQPPPAVVASRVQERSETFIGKFIDQLDGNGMCDRFLGGNWRSARAQYPRDEKKKGGMRPGRRTRAPTPKRHGTQLPTAARMILERWFDNHVQEPYPTEAQRDALVRETGLTCKQVGHYFTNRRKRDTAWRLRYALFRGPGRRPNKRPAVPVSAVRRSRRISRSRRLRWAARDGPSDPNDGTDCPNDACSNDADDS